MSIQAGWSRSYKKKDPTGNYFFRPYKNHRQQETLAPEINADDNILQGVANECGQTLMFCMQNAFMKMAMEKYSGDVVWLDATNKTTDYSLPLVFLVVKTPTGYVHCSV